MKTRKATGSSWYGTATARNYKENRNDTYNGDKVVANVALMRYRLLVMSRSRTPSDTPTEAQTSIKVVISFRLPAELASWLRKKAVDEGDSLNDIVVTALDDLRSWFSATKPVAELLEADRKAFGDSTREYLRRLLQYRYDELVRDSQNVGQKAGGSPDRK